MKSRPGHELGLFTSSAHGLEKMAGRDGSEPVSGGPGLKFSKFVHGHGRVLCYYVVFLTVRLKNKGKERSAYGPAQPGSCRCKHEIFFFYHDWPAANVANSGSDRTSSGLMPGRIRPQAGSAGPKSCWPDPCTPLMKRVIIRPISSSHFEKKNTYGKK